jgi:hypothetical protein
VLPIDAQINIKNLSRWLTKGFWAVSDQGLFSLSNFALNLLLARWLVPQDYGAFTVALSVFYLVGTFHGALLTEPMLVFAPSRYKGRFPEYLGALLYGHLGFAILSSLPRKSGFSFGGKVYDAMRELAHWPGERDSLLRATTVRRSVRTLAAAERTATQWLRKLGAEDDQVLAQVGLGKKEMDGLSSVGLKQPGSRGVLVSDGTHQHVKDLYEERRC